MEGFLIIILQLATAVPASIADCRRKEIPLTIIIPGISAMIILRLHFSVSGYSLFICAIPAFVFFVIIRSVSRNGMGLGDAFISIFISLSLGLRLWMISVLISSLSALIFCLAVLKLELTDREYRLPFGPFLFAGAILVQIYTIAEPYCIVEKSGLLLRLLQIPAPGIFL